MTRSFKTTYPVKGEEIKYVSDAEMNNILQSYGRPLWRAKLIGGIVFVDSKQIIIREKRRGDIKLLNHERGHIRGYGHTWYPTLMFPSWAGRFFNSYYPPYME